MIIPIDAKRRIVGTERAWELQRTRIRDGKLTWEPYKWFTTLRQALEEAVQREIRIHPATSLSEAIEAVSGVVQKYEKLIPSEHRFRCEECPSEGYLEVALEKGPKRGASIRNADCSFCGSNFVRKRRDTKYCTKTCRQACYRARKQK